MTGPEHYQEAEQILREFLSGEAGEPGGFEFSRTELLATTQVHATLANAPIHRASYERAWLDAAGTKLSGQAPQPGRHH